MRRTEQLQGLRLMKFDEVYGRTYRGELSQLEAAEILGMSERTFRRWRDRFEAEGAEGLYDRRLGRVSARRAGVDEVVALLDLFDTRYRHFTAWHFWDVNGGAKLVHPGGAKLVHLIQIPHIDQLLDVVRDVRALVIPTLPPSRG